MAMEMIRPEGFAPDITPGYPSGGASIAPAWQAMWDALTPGRWIRGDRVAEIGASAGLILADTALHILRAARKAGLLQVETRWCGDPGEMVRKRAFYRRSA